MPSFNENLDNFLTECRENAVRELGSSKSYTDWKTTQTDLRSRLEALISPEARKILDEYVEAVTDVQRMEAGRILLCGLTLPAEIQKRFDTSTAEHKVFAEEYL